MFPLNQKQRLETHEVLTWHLVREDALKAGASQGTPGSAPSPSVITSARFFLQSFRMQGESLQADVFKVQTGERALLSPCAGLAHAFPRTSPQHTSPRAAISHGPDSAKRRELFPRAGLSGVPRAGRGPSDCPSNTWLRGFAYVIGDDRHLGQRPARRRSSAHAFPFPRKQLL